MNIGLQMKQQPEKDSFVTLENIFDFMHVRGDQI